jgi:hypothetical protein
VSLIWAVVGVHSGSTLIFVHRRPEPEVPMSTYGQDDETIYAKQEERVRNSRSTRFDELLRDQDAARHGHRPELSDDAKRSVAEFEREVAELNRLVDAEIENLVPARGPSFDHTAMTRDEHLHVFGPGTLTEGWAWQGDGNAGSDVANGTFYAYNYTTGPARFSVAQVGVKFQPTPALCKLSVRPYVRCTGYDILKHAVHQPGTGEQRRAWALGSVGIKVDSWDPGGGNYNVDGETWVNLWDRSEVNPTISQEFDQSVTVSDGLILEPIAINSRQYALWITCRVGVSADPGFEVSTYATSSIGCQLVYFVAEEIEHW